MFLRRIFYDSISGEALSTYEMRGLFRPTDAENDPNRPEGANVANLDWTAPDVDVERKLAENRTLMIELDTHALIWGEPNSALPDMPEVPPESADPELEDAVAALQLLGYTEGEA